MSTYPTFEDGMAVVKRVQEETGATWAQMRRIGSNHLQEQGWPEDHGISSSDVNHHLASMGHHYEAELRKAAEDEVWAQNMVSKIMESSGKTERQVREDIARMFEEA